jgi:hypothetical protein
MKMKTLTLIAMTSMTLAAFAPLTPALAQAEIKSVPMPPPSVLPSQAPPSAAALAWSQKHLAAWPEALRRIGAQLTTKYGEPAEVTPRQITWLNTGPWVRTTLFKDGLTHNFASPHRNVLQQAVLYKVPIDKLVPLAQFSRSLVVDLARGELITSSESEEVNFLMVNIADDVIKGQRTAEEARIYFAQLVRAKMIKEPEKDLQKLQFTPPKSAKETADADEVAPLIRHMNGDNSFE